MNKHKNATERLSRQQEFLPTFTLTNCQKAEGANLNLKHKNRILEQEYYVD